MKEGRNCQQGITADSQNQESNTVAVNKNNREGCCLGYGLGMFIWYFAITILIAHIINITTIGNTTPFTIEDVFLSTFLSFIILVVFLD